MKKRHHQIISGLAFLLFILCITSCLEDDTCSENAITGINISIANSGNDSSYDTDTLDESSIESWKICPLEDSTIFAGNEITTFTPGIPLDLNDTSITVAFLIRDHEDDDYIRDTLQFHYHQTDLKLISVQCGFAPTYILTGYKHSLNVLDSISVSLDEISNDISQNNVTLYY